MVYSWDSMVEAQEEAIRLYSDLPGFSGVGLGQQKVRVYVKFPQLKSKIASEVNGIPTETIVVGDIKAL